MTVSESPEMRERRKQAYTELASMFKSGTEMAAHFGVSLPAISRWKRNGVPASRVPYFMLRYPRLKAWEGLPRGV